MLALLLWQGLTPLEGGREGETSTRGLEQLVEACRSYTAAGATFAKWRAALRVVEGSCPSEAAYETNASQLAQYAAICQVGRGTARRMVLSSEVLHCDCTKPVPAVAASPPVAMVGACQNEAQPAPWQPFRVCNAAELGPFHQHQHAAAAHATAVQDTVQLPSAV